MVSVGPTLERGTVAAYSASGAFAGAFGRYGAGPGEMREIHGLIGGSADTIYVLHDNYLSTFTSQGEFVRTIPWTSTSFLTRKAYLAGTGEILAVRTGTIGGPDHAMRHFRVDGTPGRGYGPNDQFGSGRIYADAVVMGEMVYAIDTRSYEIDVYSAERSEAVEVMARTLEWFRPVRRVPPTGCVPPSSQWGRRLKGGSGCF